MNTKIILSVLSAAASVAAAPANAQDQSAKLTVQESAEHGAYVADADGRALYMFEADTRGEGDEKASSACYDACAKAWPPLVVADTPEAGDKVQAEMIGTIERKGGDKQATYSGWPLYYYMKDQGAGQTTGQDIEGFGGEWYLMSPSGEVVGH